MNNITKNIYNLLILLNRYKMGYIMEKKYEELYDQYSTLKKENEKLKNRITLLEKHLYDNNLSNLIDTTNLFLTKYKQKDNESSISMNSSVDIKIDLFMSLFKGRYDVCAKKWNNKKGYSPFCLNDFKLGICNKPKVKCINCSNSNFFPLDEERIKNHLLGNYILGLYPITKDDTCYLTAVDFDGITWKDDVQALLETCKKNDFRCYIERSQSGNGAHVWFFFNQEIKASLAREFVVTLISMTMELTKNIKFDSFDRLFPNQDFLQKDGFGNLISLPLQKKSRNDSNTVFIDENFNEITDQWAYLSKVKKIAVDEVQKFLGNKRFRTTNDVKNIIYKKNELFINTTDFENSLKLIKDKGIIISKEYLSSKALLLLRRLASYNNPEFFEKQAMRISTYGTPRITVVYDESEENIMLPRGVENELVTLLNKNNINYKLIDNRFKGRELNIKFNGNLDDKQELAFQELVKFDDGVLSAHTGFGKTVLAANIIATKKQSTLILVHTKELAKQWKERLDEFLIINEEVINKKKNVSLIGMLGGGKNSLNGIVDIALMQSMFDREKEVKSFISQYGLVIIDECHHISAANFSRIAKNISSKYLYGLSATPIRKDGHHPIIFMSCGPIRYKTNSKTDALLRDFEHFIIPRFTNIRMPTFKENNKWHISEIYEHICQSNYRNNLIVSDIIDAVNSGRNPLVLTERSSQVDKLVKLLENVDFKVLVLTGKLKNKERNECLQTINELKVNEKFVIIATGKLIGEGFDLSRLDTLFMAMPIAWKGTITQYAGRLHRSYIGKKEVLIYDYVDIYVPTLERMYHKRVKAYKSIGYQLKSDISNNQLESHIFDEDNYFNSFLNDINISNNNILISINNIQKSKINDFQNILIEKFRSGVRIVLCLKLINEYPDKYKNYMIEFIRNMEFEGIKTIQIQNNYLNFSIIDNRIIWYGNIDIFGYNFKDRSIIRINDEALANEFIGIVNR